MIAVARFDFSCLDMDYHQETVDNLRVAARNVKQLCGVSKYPVIVGELDNFFASFYLVMNK